MNLVVLHAGGGVVEVKANDGNMPYLVMPYPRGGEVYSINGPLFDSTYRLEDPQRRVPTHEELVVEWSRVFQNEDGTRFDESEVVFAKAAIDECDPPPKIAETTEVELWIDEDPAPKKADNEMDAVKPSQDTRSQPGDKIDLLIDI